MSFRKQTLLLLLLLLLLLVLVIGSAEEDPAPYPAAATQASAVTAPFDGIPRQHIQNGPPPNSTVHDAVAGATHTSRNGRCHRAIRRYPQSCSLIRKHCAGYGDGIINYVELYFCAYKTHHAAVLALLTAWLALLFVWLGVSASEYFSPNISTLAQLMRLPESLAGVTLLALGNGAPDLFSTFSAVRAGSGALALGQLIGSASFIVSVVVGATTLVAPVYKVSQLSYLRELGFFVATIGMIAVIVLSERLSQGLAICMVGLYVTYVVTVMVTTYYEEQHLALEESSVDDVSSPIAAQADQLAESVCPEPPPWDIQPGGDIQRTGISSARIGQLQPQGHRSQKTTCAICPGSADRRSLDSPHGNGISVRVLGEFLHHHPKSLLAAAECSDIFEEMRVSQSHRGALALESSAWPHLTTASSSVAENQLGYDARRFIPADTAGSSTHPNICAAPRPPPIQPQLCVLKVGLPSTEPIDPDCVPGAGTELDIALAAGDEPWHTGSSVSLYNCSQFPLATGELQAKGSISAEPPSISQGEFLLPTSSKAAIGAMHTPLSRRSQESFAVVDTAQQARRYAHSSVCLPTIEINSAPFLPLQTVLASASRIDMLACSHQSPSLLAASPWDQAPGSVAPYLAPISDAVVSKIGRTQAVVFMCVPTLRHWRPEASLYLKLFIAFSALPVLLLSITVPVLARLPESKEDVSDFRELSVHSEDGDSTSNNYHSSQLHGAATSQELARRDEEWRRHTEADSHDAHRGLNMAKLPAERASLSRSSSSSHLHIVLDDLTRGHSVQALNAATAAWAEGVVSSVRSVMSVAFIYSAFCLSGHVARDTGWATRTSLGLALALLSLLGNHVSRRAHQQHYWLQVAPCFFGVACGLAWVYIIASEVVSITQALGLMLGLSEEILGLTVVGFGNSLGDLVTNLTLTRMGYPMMAMSACFGGPMLCLLIGVGVAAYGIMAGSAPDGDDTYRMPITSPTVLVSTACLLLNSLIYLVAIPRKDYHMTRGIGLAALAVYFTGMAVNVYLEW